MKIPLSTTRFLCILLLFGLFCFQATAQSIVINRGGQKYIEANNINRFNIKIKHNKIINLINDICECFDEKTKKCRRGVYKGFEVAGLAFISLWHPDKLKMNNDTIPFETVGIRIAVVLWKENDNETPDEVIFATFDRLEDAFVPVTQQLPSSAKTIDIIVPKSCYDIEGLSFFDSTREFDLVFLSYDSYKYLATETSYYVTGQRNEKAITIKRSLISMDGIFINNPGIKNFRSLYFQPFPVPDLPFRDDNEASTAIFNHGIHCPPYWRNGLAPSVSDMVIQEMQKAKTPPLKPITGVNFNTGWIPSFGRRGMLSSSSAPFEMGIEYIPKILKHRLSVETQIGRYLLSDEKLHSLNLLLKYHIPSSEKNRFYFATGIGVNDFLAKTDTGLITRIGTDYEVFHNFRIAGGVQYQNISWFNNRSQTMHLWGAKAGIKYLF